MGTNPSTFTNRNNTSTDGGVIYVNGETYTLARTETFYYLEFINYDKELFKTASNLTSKPTLIFYTEGSTDKVIFDYTLANATDKKYLNSFFANITPSGQTFSMIKGDYLDVAELSADVSCTVTFASYGDYKAFGNVVSVTKTNPASDVYLSDYFTGTPQLTKTGSLGYTASTINYALVSVNPNTNKPLSYMGITAGDIIEVVNNTSANTHSLFKITDITTINNKEVLKINSIYGIIPTIESLIGSMSILNVYIKGTTTSTADFNGDVGCCVNKTTYQKISNSTEYQCSLRTNNYSFIAGSCDSVSNTSIVQPPSTVITNTYSTSQEVLSSNVVFESTISFINEITPQLNLILVKGDSYYIFNNQIKLSPGIKYCFSQTDVSNRSYTVRFSTTQETFTPYVAGIYGGVSYRGITSNQFLNSSFFDYPTLYLFLEYTGNMTSTNKNPEYIKTNYYISN